MPVQPHLQSYLPSCKLIPADKTQWSWKTDFSKKTPFQTLFSHKTNSSGHLRDSEHTVQFICSHDSSSLFLDGWFWIWQLFFFTHWLVPLSLQAILSKLPSEWGMGGGGTSWNHWQWFHWELRSNKRSAEYHPWGATYPTGSPPTPRHCAPSPVDVPQTYPHHTATQAQLCCDCSPEWDVTRCSRTWADSWGLHSPVTFSSLAAAYPPIPSPHFLRKKKACICHYLIPAICFQTASDLLASFWILLP